MAGVLVVFDPGPLIGNVGEESVREALSNTDVLLLTLEEARMLVKAAVADQAARQLLDCGPRLIGLKLGEDGCLLANREGVQRFEPFRVDCRDTCGAGDAFDAACTFGLLRGMPLSRLGILANAVGAATVAVLGSGTRLPGRSAILNLVRDSAARSFASDDVDAIVSSLEAR